MRRVPLVHYFSSPRLPSALRRHPPLDLYRFLRFTAVADLESNLHSEPATRDLLLPGCILNIRPRSLIPRLCGVCIRNLAAVYGNLEVRN